MRVGTEKSFTTIIYKSISILSNIYVLDIRRRMYKKMFSIINE